MILSIDIETYSDVDLNKYGVYRYVEGDFHILLFAFAFDDNPVYVIDLANGNDIPEDIVKAIFNDAITKYAWNANFERTCLSKYFNKQLKPDSWRCSMIHAASLSLPLKLETTAEILKVSEQKDKKGKDLIKYFSVQCKPTKSNNGRIRNLPKHEANPGDWQKFIDYCAQDVRTERAIRKKLEKFPMPYFEWNYYHMDQRINDRGILIDTELVSNAINCAQNISQNLMSKAKKLTSLENPNSTLQLKNWLKEKGINVPSLGKKDVSELLKTIKNTNISDVLNLRSQMSKSSIKKYQAAQDCACKDNRARGLFQFYGANRTGRWAGRRIQLQNLPQNHISTLNEARTLLKLGALDMLNLCYDNISDILSQLIRTMLIPKTGYEFIICDFSAIEARILSWLANEEWRIKAFQNGEDIYLLGIRFQDV